MIPNLSRKDVFALVAMYARVRAAEVGTMPAEPTKLAEEAYTIAARLVNLLDTPKPSLGLHVRDIFPNAREL